MKNKIELFILLLLIFLGGSLYLHVDVLTYIIIVVMTITTIYKLSQKIPSPLNNDCSYMKAFEKHGIYAKLDKDNNIIYANRQFYQIFNIKKQENGKMPFSQLAKEDKNKIYDTLIHNQTWESIKKFTTKSSIVLSLDCSFIPILDKHNTLKEVLFFATDITELTRSKTILKEHQHIDSLTKLPNRLKLFSDKNNENLKKEEFTYILFNIDSFNAINDLYGTTFGDGILIKVARWLENNLIIPQAKLYKLESDIYIMVLFKNIEEDFLKNYLQYITKKIDEEVFIHNDISIDLTMTIGASQDKTRELKLANLAFKEAKSSNKSFAIYDRTSNKEKEYTNNIKISKTIRNAIKNDLVIPYFQPIVDANTGEIEKYETLMRIKDETGRVLSPYEFLDIAKHSKHYSDLSCMLIKKAVYTFKINPCSFSVNLSYLDIINPTTTEFILNLLEETGIGPWIIFEILESEGIENYKEIMDFIAHVRAFGAKIAIDDFGSGYSSFERIVKLQPNFLKIDGSIIKNIDKNNDMKIITKTIHNFAKELNIETIAEFVHSKEVLEEIQYLDIDYAQGYYFGAPSETL